MKRYVTWLYAILFLLIVAESQAQVFSTKGREFWVSFMQNSELQNIQLALFFSADSTTSVTVEIPGQAPVTQTVTPSSTTRINVTRSTATYNNVSNTIQNSGIRITANNPISVYAFNTEATSTDATLILPVESLGNEYYTFNRQFNTSQNWNSQIMVIGTNDNSQVEITPKSDIINASGVVIRPANVPFTITLNRGSVYFAKGRSTPNSGDLTGTRIRNVNTTSCTGFAVFSGHLRTDIQSTSGGGYDHLFEQMFPTQSWGRNFVIAPFVFSRSYELRIIARRNGTTVNAGTLGTFTMNAGEARVFNSVSSLTAISATQPIAVAQYMKSGNDNFGGTSNTTGDPFLMWIAPVEQLIDKVTFHTFDPGTNNQWVNNMYVSILVPTASVSTCRLDNILLSAIPNATTPTSAPAIVAAHIATINGTSYTINVVRVSQGNHTISNPGGIIANVYAMARVDSYGFLAGAAVSDLENKISIVGIKDDTTVCPNQQVVMRGSAIDSAEIISWRWLLPGGNQPTTQQISTSFPDTGTVRVKLVVERSNGCRFDTLETSVRVRNDLRVRVTDTALCPGFANVVLRTTTSNGTAPFVFTWAALNQVTIAAGIGTNSVVVTTPQVGGTYRVVVSITDKDGCFSPIDTAEIIVHPAPAITFNRIDSVCAGLPRTISATIGASTASPFRFRWSPSTGIIGSDTGSSITVLQTTPGRYTYTVQVTDSRGCIGTDSITFTVLALPTVNAGADIRIICIGDSTDIGTGGQISGGATPYQSTVWRRINAGAANIINPSQLNTRIHPTISGNYVFEVTDANGCIGRDTVFCDVRQIPDANAGADLSDCVCEKSPKRIGVESRCGEAPFTYTWRALGTAPISALSATNTVPVTLTITDNPSRTTLYQYELTVSDAQNRTTRDTMSYSLHPCPTADAGADITLCGPAAPTQLRPTVTIDSVDGIEYRWTPALFLNNATIEQPTVTLPDSNISIVYRLQVRTKYGCTAIDSMTVRTAKTLRVTATLNKQKTGCICRGDQVQLSVVEQGGTPQYQYAWTGNGLVSTTTQNVTANPLASTTFRITVTDARGCTSFDTVSVCVEPVPNPLPASDTAICNGDVTPPRGNESTCGKPPFKYLWSPAAGVSDVNIFNPRFSPSATTTYTLSVTDDNGNGVTNSATMTIRVNELPTVQIGNDTSFCSGGTIATTAVASGGSGAGYLFEWFVNTIKDGQTTATAIFSGIDRDADIACRVTDANGCSNTDNLIVKIFPGPVLAIPSDLFVCPCDSLKIGGVATGGTPGYTYRWRDPLGGPVLEMDDSTSATPVVRLSRSRTYIVDVTDTKGCTTQGVQSILLGEGTQSVAFTVPDVTADPRNKNVAIPIAVSGYPQGQACPPKSLEFTVEYDSWLYDPKPRVSNGTVVTNILNGRQRELRIRIAPVPAYNADAVVTTLTGAALLGDPGVTRVVVKNVQWGCSSLVSDTASGQFSLDSLCLKPSGKARMLDFGTSADLVSIVPNPSNGVSFVTVRRSGNEAVHLKVTTIDGTVVHSEEWQGNGETIVQQQSSPLEETKTFIVNAGDLPQGVYRCVVQSTAGMVSGQLVIVR